MVEYVLMSGGYLLCLMGFCVAWLWVLTIASGRAGPSGEAEVKGYLYE